MVVGTNRNPSRADHQVGAIERCGQGRLGGFEGVAGLSGGGHRAPVADRQRRERGEVGVVQLPRLERLPGRPELVAGGHDGHGGPASAFEPRHAGGHRDPEGRRVKDAPGFQHLLPGSQVFAGPPYVPAFAQLVGRNDGVATVLEELELEHPERPLGDDRPG